MTQNMESINADWDGAGYDMQPLPHEHWGQDVIARCRLEGTEKVIDAGCGTGRDATAIATLLAELSAAAGVDLGGSVHAFDLNDSMLQQAAARFSRMNERWRPTLSSGNIMLPWPSKNADVAFTVATFHWVGDHRAAFTQAAAALKIGGRFVGECGGHGNIANAVAAASAVDPTYVRPAWNFADVDDTIENLEAAGFHVEDVRARLEPVIFPTKDSAYDYLRSVVFHTMDEEPLREVAALMGDTLNYVRLEWEATAR